LRQAIEVKTLFFCHLDYFLRILDGSIPHPYTLSCPLLKFSRSTDSAGR
jgi:hypothetical protein